MRHRLPICQNQQAAGLLPTRTRPHQLSPRSPVLAFVGQWPLRWQMLLNEVSLSFKALFGAAKAEYPTSVPVPVALALERTLLCLTECR